MNKSIKKEDDHIFCHPLFWLFQCLQPFPLEDQHIEHANGDSRIGKIKYGSEEDEMPVRAEEEIRQPGGILAGDVDDGEIEHIDYAPVQPAGIAATVGEEGRDFGEGAFAEDAPVEHAVDDVAHGTCGDEGNAKQDTELSAFLRLTDQNPEQDHDGHDPEKAQGELPQSAATKPTEGHAVVLNKQQVEPASDDRNLLVQGHTRLHPNLEDLVEEQHEKNHHKRPYQAAATLFFHFFFSLASRQRVVMGTQRSLSLGMSFPVSQQMP